MEATFHLFKLENIFASEHEDTELSAGWGAGWSTGLDTGKSGNYVN